MAIRVGIGGWTYEPWRGTFYPEGLKHASELEYASAKLTAIEINGTFYRSQGAASFTKWRQETPEDFVFTVKGHRGVVNRKVMAEAGESIEWFFRSGVLELGDKLGPVLWQLPPYKKFERDDLAAFFGLLPRSLGGRAIGHALEVRHASFLDAAFIDLARDHGVAVVHVDAEGRPGIADVTADFVYARLERTQASEPAGYAPAAIDLWAERARVWEAGGAPGDLALLAGPAEVRARPVFVFMISGAKERAPAAAMALIGRLAGQG